MIFFCFFCGIFAYGAADSRLSTLFRTNGNATADILIAVIKTFPTTDCIYMTIVDYTAIGQSLFDDDQTTNLTHRSRLTAQHNGLLHLGVQTLRQTAPVLSENKKIYPFTLRYFSVGCPIPMSVNAFRLNVHKSGVVCEHNFSPSLRYASFILIGHFTLSASYTFP